MFTNVPDAHLGVSDHKNDRIVSNRPLTTLQGIYQFVKRVLRDRMSKHIIIFVKDTACYRRFFRVIFILVASVTDSCKHVGPKFDDTPLSCLIPRPLPRS